MGCSEGGPGGAAAYDKNSIYKPALWYKTLTPRHQRSPVGVKLLSWGGGEKQTNSKKPSCSPSLQVKKILLYLIWHQKGISLYIHLSKPHPSLVSSILLLQDLLLGAGEEGGGGAEEGYALSVYLPACMPVCLSVYLSRDQPYRHQHSDVLVARLD